MAGILEGAGLPQLLETMMRPWVTALETGTLGMRDEVAAAASGTATSLKRRIIVVPALDKAITQAMVTSATFADVLGRPKGTTTTQARAAALASLEVVIEHLRAVEPSEDTRSLGLGW
jgi:hypothetical protein